MKLKMSKIRFRDMLPWIWEGKSITRSMMNAMLKSVVLPEGKVIDLGGGGRPSYLDVLSINGKLYNMDMLVEANPTFVGNLEKPLPIRNNVADAVLLFNTLEHVFDYQLVVNEMHRILKPGGKAVIFVPFMIGYHTYQGKSFLIDDYFRYTRSSLSRVFGEAGFASTNIVPLGGLFWVVAELLKVGLKFRVLTFCSTIVCSLLETIIMCNRGFNSVEKYPLGYFVEAQK